MWDVIITARYREGVWRGVVRNGWGEDVWISDPVVDIKTAGRAARSWVIHNVGRPDGIVDCVRLYEKGLV